MIFAGVNGYLDKLPVNKVGAFESGLLSHMRSEGKAVLDAIQKERQITDDIKSKLKAEIDTFAKSFAA